ncbi:cystatin-like isoform X2 [Anoplopoma fimbria]|uniref:cystatin-like isoform X2 n=1 Tax=Anoplopoma fimbria TaxID=229290 RepID=UPI0023EC2845|nr:cystatin-like isoform X2 [Anoplopoma fimbria]
MFVWFCVFVYTSAGCLETTGQVMTGQPHKVPVNSTEVLVAALFAVVEFNAANAEEQFAYKIVNITSAKIQLGRTVCKRNNTAVNEPCVFHPEPKELQCCFIVTEIPWEDSRVLTQNKCHPPNH